MYDNIIVLVGTAEKHTNEYGDTVSSVSERKVFAELASIGGAEFYQAQAAGIKPELKFKLADYLDYAGERMLRFTPPGESEQLYSIIRTYRKSNELELVCRRGVNQ